MRLGFLCLKVLIPFCEDLYDGGREYTIHMAKIVEPLQVLLMKSFHSTTAFRLRGWRLILHESTVM